jgi:hypothetical protein
MQIRRLKNTKKFRKLNRKADKNIFNLKLWGIMYSIKWIWEWKQRWTRVKSVRRSNNLWKS